jgi:hypothetical protein
MEGAVGIVLLSLALGLEHDLMLWANARRNLCVYFWFTTASRHFTSGVKTTSTA